MFDINVVILCDRVLERKNIDAFTDNLEYTSNTYFDALYDALSQLCLKVYVYQDIVDFKKNLELHKDDIVFTAIWSGKQSRNRKSIAAALCESYNIRYVGADVYAQTISQDKHLSQLYCKEFDIKTPKSQIIRNLDDYNKIRLFTLPLIVKPTYEGGSMGISDDNICYSYDDAVRKSEELKPFYKSILIEEYIAGQEIAACIIGTPEEITHCEYVRLEINDKKFLTNEVWGYESKKCNKSKITRTVITNSMSDNNKHKILELYQSLGKVDYMRIDFRLNDNDEMYLIEFTPDCSLHPDCFMATSFTYYNKRYVDMIKSILETQI